MKFTWNLPLDPDGIHGELDDGSPFVIRPIRSTDGPSLDAAFARMSPRSRYLRFFSVRERLGDDLLEMLTDIDHDQHRAWVVADPTVPSEVDGSDEGLGIAVARLINVAGEPGVAEAALVVADDYQRRGFGRLLLELLIGTARDTGIEFIRFETLYENRGMRGLLSGLAAVKNDTLSDREILVFDLPVNEELGDGDGVAIGALYELLRFIAAKDELTDRDG